MIKRLLMMILVIALFTLGTSYAIEGASDWAEDDLERLYEYSILKEEAFKNPKEDITREDFIYLMVTLYEDLAEETIEVDPNITFRDTDDIYALKAATVGITKGVGNDRFAPNEYLTREQMAVFIMKILKLTDKSYDEEMKGLPFNDDEAISSWAKESVYFAMGNGFFSGVGVNKFAPQMKATREQSLVLFKRLIHRYSLTGYSSMLSQKRVEEYDGPYTLSLENALDGIVKIYVLRNDETMKVGSGFYYDFNKIATNFHLIDEASEIVIEYADGEYYRGDVKILGFDQSMDIAALKSVREKHHYS